VALSVLVTRPSGRADALVAALADAGFSVRHVPLLSVAPLDPAADADIYQRTKALLLNLDNYQRVIAISVNAVHFGIEWLADYWPQWPLGVRWYGIGAATAEALAQYGITAIEPGGNQNTESLLALPAFADLSGERVLILRGVGGRETLAQALRARGARVDYAECYRRLPPQLDAREAAALWQPPADAVCLNSAETLQHFWQLLPPAAQARYRDVAMIVPSARVATQARELGLRRVIVAANAGSRATVEALQQLIRGSQQ
jgi:uroporphyrinogen-III synthase